MAAYSFLAIEFQIQCDSISIYLSVCSFYLFGHFSIRCKFTYTLITERKQKMEETQKDRQGGKIQTKHATHTSYIWILWVLFDHDLVLFWTYYSTLQVSLALLKYSKSWSIPMQMRKYLCLPTACSVTACCLWLQWFTLQGEFRIDLISFCSTIDFRRQSIAPDAAILS